MKRNKNSSDKSTVYRTLGLSKITAPNSLKDEPRAGKIIGNGDLRGGRS